MIKLSRWMTYRQLKIHGVSIGKIYVYEFNSLHDVKEKNIDTWKSFSAEKCVKMIDSIPRRLEAIIRKQGQRITKRDC